MQNSTFKHGPSVKDDDQRARIASPFAFCILNFAFRPAALLLIAAACYASVTVIAAGSGKAPARQSTPPIDAQKQLDTIQQYCVGCHNDRAKTGGVSFEGVTPEGVAQHADIFEKAVRKLRGRVMPPP